MSRWMGSAAVCVAAVGALVLALGLPARDRLYPVVLCGGLLIVALIDLARSLYEARKAGADDADARAGGTGGKSGGALRTVAVVGAVIGYFALWNVLGYLVSTVLFVAAVAVLLGERKPWVVGALALGLSGAVYVTFGLVLQVPLPHGVLL